MERSLLLTELEKDDRVVTMGTSVCQTLGGGGETENAKITSISVLYSCSFLIKKSSICE